MTKTKQSGVKGIVWYPRLEKWEVRTTHDSQRMVIGYYKQLSHAKTALSAVRHVFDKHLADAWA